jgi:hypothetical protein
MKAAASRSRSPAEATWQHACSPERTMLGLERAGTLRGDAPSIVMSGPILTRGSPAGMGNSAHL